MAVLLSINDMVNAVVHGRADLELNVRIKEKGEWISFSNDEMFKMMDFWWRSLSSDARKTYHDKLMEQS